MQLIGKGSFTKAYSDGKRVYLISNDPVKECMAHKWGSKSSYFPKINFSNNDNFDYEMKLYERVTAPKKQLNKRSYENYLKLKELARNNNTSVIEKSHTCRIDHFRYEILREEILKANLTRGLKNALIGMIDGLIDYGSDICFEISPHNIAATAKGNLILLDCFFMNSKLKEARK